MTSDPQRAVIAALGSVPLAVPDIVARSGLPGSTVRRALLALVRADVATQEEGRPARYRLTFPELKDILLEG